MATKPQNDWPKVEQEAQNQHDGHFSGPSLLDPVDDFQHGDVVNAEKTISKGPQEHNYQMHVTPARVMYGTLTLTFS